MALISLVPKHLGGEEKDVHVYIRYETKEACEIIHIIIHVYATYSSWRGPSSTLIMWVHIHLLPAGITWSRRVSRWWWRRRPAGCLSTASCYSQTERSNSLVCIIWRIASWLVVVIATTVQWSAFIVLSGLLECSCVRAVIAAGPGIAATGGIGPRRFWWWGSRRAQWSRACERVIGSLECLCSRGGMLVRIKASMRNSSSICLKPFVHVDITGNI